MDHKPRRNMTFMVKCYSGSRRHRMTVLSTLKHDQQTINITFLQLFFLEPIVAHFCSQISELLTVPNSHLLMGTKKIVLGTS